MTTPERDVAAILRATLHELEIEHGHSSDHEAVWPVCTRRHAVMDRARAALLADTPSVEPAGLDEAWRAAEAAALQAGWRVNALTRTYEGQTWTANAQLVVPKGQPRHDQRQQNARGGTPAEALTRLAAHFKESIGYPDRLLPTQASDSPEKT